MKIVPVASESLGVRSMATFVEIGKLKVFIDPGAALGPKRSSGRRRIACVGRIKKEDKGNC